MKKVKLILLISLALSVLVFTSCDENKPEDLKHLYPIDGDGDINNDGQQDIDGDMNNDGQQDWGNGSHLPSIDGDFENDGTQDWNPDIDGDGSIDIIGDGINVDGDGDLNNDGSKDIGGGINIDGDLNNDGNQDWGDGSNVPSDHIKWDGTIDYDGDIDGDGSQDIGDGSNIDGDLNGDGSRDWGLGINIDGDNDINNDGTIDVVPPVDGDVDGDGDVDWGDVDIDGSFDYGSGAGEPGSSEPPASSEIPPPVEPYITLGQKRNVTVTGNALSDYRLDARDLFAGEDIASFKLLDSEFYDTLDFAVFNTDTIAKINTGNGLNWQASSESSPNGFLNINYPTSSTFLDLTLSSAELTNNDGAVKRVSIWIHQDAIDGTGTKVGWYQYTFKGLVSAAGGVHEVELVGLDAYDFTNPDHNYESGDNFLEEIYTPLN